MHPVKEEQQTGPTEERKAFVKNNLQQCFKKLQEELVKNENFIACTPDLSLKRLLELSNYQLEMGQAYQFISNIYNTRFPQQHQQPQQLKKDLIIPE